MLIYFLQGYSDAPWVGYSGDGTNSSSYEPSFKETLITSGALSISANHYGGCAVVQEASGQPNPQCWNIDRSGTYGMLGDGSIGQTLTPFWTFSLY